MSISTVKFLLLPFSCLTGATPLTCGLLPFINNDGSGDVGTSAIDIFFVTAPDAVADTTTSLLLMTSDGLLTTTDANLGEVGDKDGDLVVSSSALVFLLVFTQKY